MLNLYFWFFIGLSSSSNYGNTPSGNQYGSYNASSNKLVKDATYDSSTTAVSSTTTTTSSVNTSALSQTTTTGTKSTTTTLGKHNFRFKQFLYV